MLAIAAIAFTTGVVVGTLRHVRWTCRSITTIRCSSMASASGWVLNVWGIRLGVAALADLRVVALVGANVGVLDLRTILVVMILGWTWLVVVRLRGTGFVPGLILVVVFVHARLVGGFTTSGQG
jgi:hypothetical protein